MLENNNDNNNDNENEYELSLQIFLDFQIIKWVTHQNKNMTKWDVRNAMSITIMIVIN